MHLLQEWHQSKSIREEAICLGLLHGFSDDHNAAWAFCTYVHAGCMCFQAQRLLFLHQLLQLGTPWVLKCSPFTCSFHMYHMYPSLSIHIYIYIYIYTGILYMLFKYFSPEMSYWFRIQHTWTTWTPGHLASEFVGDALLASEGFASKFSCQLCHVLEMQH